MEGADQMSVPGTKQGNRTAGKHEVNKSTMETEL